MQNGRLSWPSFVGTEPKFREAEEGELQYMEKESNMHQNSMDQVETVVSRVGESLEGFTNTIGTLSTTLKDLSADQRTQNNQQDDLQRKMHYELQGIKDLCNHVRSNTLTTCKELKNVQWQVSEMRSGTTDANGVVSGNKGSLIYLMHEDMKTSVQSIMEALGSSVKALQEAVEAGVNPEKSLKRKYQEYKENERAAKQKREEERKQQEAEQRQKEEERSRILTVVHPLTGVKMSLTGEQYQAFIQDLTKIKPTDFAPLSGPGSVPVPPIGFPPSMGGALGGLPPPGGACSSSALLLSFACVCSVPFCSVPFFLLCFFVPVCLLCSCSAASLVFPSALLFSSALLLSFLLLSVLFVCLFVCLSLCLFVCLSACLFLQVRDPTVLFRGKPTPKNHSGSNTKSPKGVHNLLTDPPTIKSNQSN